jgi:hypothetical protein
MAVGRKEIVRMSGLFGIWIYWDRGFIADRTGIKYQK